MMMIMVMMATRVPARMKRLSKQTATLTAAMHAMTHPALALQLGKVALQQQEEERE